MHLSFYDFILYNESKVLSQSCKIAIIFLIKYFVLRMKHELRIFSTSIYINHKYQNMRGAAVRIHFMPLVLCAYYYAYHQLI